MVHTLVDHRLSIAAARPSLGIAGFKEIRNRSRVAESWLCVLRAYVGLCTRNGSTKVAGRLRKVGQSRGLM